MTMVVTKVRTKGEEADEEMEKSKARGRTALLNKEHQYRIMDFIDDNPSATLDQLWMILQDRLTI